jgi:4-amino-4-deoxy-L-arabinose transferase-like glycosyltransferase
MSARINATEDRSTSIAVRHSAPSVTAVLLLIWIVAVTGSGAVLALRAFGIPVGGDVLPNRAPVATLWGAAFIVITCASAALLTRRFEPTATLPITMAIGGVVLLAGAAGMGSVTALVVALALAVLAWLLGEVVLPIEPEGASVPLVRLPIAFAVGSGLVGLFLLGLTAFGALNAVTVTGAAGILLVVLAIFGGNRFSGEISRLQVWQPASPTWVESVVLGLAVGLVAYASLAAFAPGTHSDAIRHHLPIAREIWQTGSAPEFPPMTTARYPIQAHLLYAVAYGFGGMTAATLVHTLVGLVTLLGIAGIGWLLAGRTAATVGAAIFTTMPLVLWELGTAYLDLFPVLFTVGAVLCVLLWQRHGPLAWLAVAGVLAGFGFTAKMTMGLMIVALGLALVFVGRGPWQWRERLLAGVAFGFGAAAVMLPWILRSYILTGAIPGLSILTEHATGSATSDLPGFGLGRSPLDLLRIPWAMTFQGELFNQSGGGDIGIVLLMTLPLAVLGPRTRATAFLAISGALSYLGWAFTAQYTRYLLPALAIAAAFAGIGVASAMAASTVSPRRLLAAAVPAGVVLGLLASPLLLLPSPKSREPVIDVITGRVSASEYVTDEIPAAAALAAASALLPPDTPIGYFGLEQEGAQAYTEARLTYFPADPVNMTPGGVLIDLDLLGTTSEEVLASLERLGVEYFIWARSESRAQDWRSTLLSTPFLREHTRILSGDHGGYLFEIVPGGDSWGTPDGNLLQDPDLERIGADDGPWTAKGRSKARRGAVALRPRDLIAQRVPVNGTTPYLLVVSSRCEEPEQRAELVLRWLDDQGNTLSTDQELVLPGTEWSDQFLWHVAPERATSVSVELSSGNGSSCEVDETALNAPSPSNETAPAPASLEADTKADKQGEKSEGKNRKHEARGDKSSQ